jgi:transcriptional regulator with XRE-family HTH domain
MNRWHEFEDLRVQAGWTLRAVGRAAGVAPGYLSELRSGKKAPTPMVVRKLADAFGVGMDDLGSVLDDAGR